MACQYISNVPENNKTFLQDLISMQEHNDPNHSKHLYEHHKHRLSDPGYRIIHLPRGGTIVRTIIGNI